VSRLHRLSRREVLRALALLSLSGCDSARPGRGFLGAMERFNLNAQKSLLRPGHLAREWPEGSETPLADFPKYFISDEVPEAPDDWALQIGGRVAHPLTLSVNDLMKLPRTQIRVQHHCVEGWSAVASWHGVRVSDLARLVGADPRAQYVEFRSFDGDYWSSWDRESALHPQTLIAYGMNGQPLTPEHGAPARLYGAVKLGYKMVKYLTAVNFLAEPTGGYWESRGYEWFAGV
jgi:DMSO/TMAO reductase YedYZ molybdopterin-dependent catalytic subunit